MRTPPQLPTSLARYLAGFVARRRGTLALRSVGGALAVATGWLLATCVVDRFIPLAEPARWAGLAVGLTVLVAGVARAAWHLLRPVDSNLAAARVEARTPVFQERLRTVTSQLLADDPSRGSASMLGRTLADVERLLPAAPGHLLAPWRAALPAWVAAGAVALALGGATRVPSWHFDTLLARAIFPHRPVEPVTLTRLVISPKNVRVSPGETLVVSAGISGERALAAQARGVDLFLSADGKSWSRASMNAKELGGAVARFEFPIPAIERDLRYYVRAGDATSDVYTVGVHRVPAATLFRIRYDYPPYTGHGPVTVTNADGALECLAGSTATVTVIASEPLSAAAWTIGGDRFPMSRVSRDEEWQVSFPVARTANSALEMTSTAGVAGRGPSPMPARVTVDEAPKPVVLQPASDVRLSADDVTPVRFAATDDYGLREMECLVRVNGKNVVRAPVPIGGRPLRREGEFALDLAALGVSVGDVVTLTVTAGDWWGQSKLNTQRTILVAPNAAPPRAYERAAELRRAAALARAWADDLGKARRALDAARAADPKAARQEPWAAAARALSVAGDAAAALRQSLLRATLRADSEALADALATWVDQASAVLTEPGRPLSPASRGDDGLSDRLNASIGRCRELAAALDAVQQGEGAAAVSVDLLNYRALSASTPTTAPADPSTSEAAALRATAVGHLRETVDAWLRDLSLGAASADVVRQLDGRVRREREVLGGVRRVDLVAAAREWASHAARNPGGAVALEFPARLAVAAEAQALRPGGSVALAGDLALASRAAAGLNGATATPRAGSGKGKARPAPAYAQFPAALASLLAGDAAAREPLRAWAAAAAETDPADAAERFAIAASVALAGSDYAAAAKADAALAKEIARWSPEQSERFAQLVEKTSANVRDAQALAREQGDVAEALRDGDPAGNAIERQAQLAGTIGDLSRLIDVLPVTGGGAATEVGVEFEEGAVQASSRPEPSAALAARRPTLAAAWHARAASDALAAAGDEPMELAAAMLRGQAAIHQQQVVALLAQTSDHLLHRETVRRLAEVPSLAAIFQPATSQSPGQPEGAVATERLAPTVKDWLRGSAETPDDAAPPKLREQLQAYFDQISKAQQGRK